MSEHDKRWLQQLRNDGEERAADLIEAQAEALGECFRLAGGDTDGNPGPHHAHRAVEVVRDLRECYEERGVDLEKAEANARRYLFLRDDPPTWLCVRINRDGCNALYTDGSELDAAIDDAMRGGAE
jgi:hypothetical protein